MKKASWLVALLLGVVIGVAATRMVGGGGSGAAGVLPAPAPQLAQPRTPTPAQRGPEDPKAVYRVPLDDSPVKGPADALVTVVISSDFQCPFCRRALPALAQLEQEYAGKIRFAFKHNPLPFHDKAMPAAIAAEEARAQGGDAKFWQMHDALFEANANLDRAALEAAGQKVGLDGAKLKRALDENRYADRIRRDQALANSLGGSGTPTFFINGRKVVGAVPYDTFKKVADEELAKADAMVKSGVPASQVYARIVEKGATQPAYLPAGAGAGAQPQAAAPAAPPPSQSAKVALRGDEAARGPEGAKVTIVLFSDFQCPFCSRVEPTLKRLDEAFPGQLRVVWKHQPLPFHPNALPAALAAEAAHAQGKFWQMHDQMFQHQTELAPAKYVEWARAIGLDVKRFEADVAKGSGRARIEEDQKQAAQVGAQGTPTLFLNCRKVVGALPFESFKPVVEEEIRKADALAAKGVRGAALYDALCEQNVKTLAAAAPVAPPAAAPERVDAAAVAREIRKDDPARGAANAPVTVLVFSDFQCPFCGRAVPTMKQIEGAYRDQVRIVWKHQPLPFHSNALPAALAAEAAREQGKFWPMHDKLFENQASLSPETYERLARELGLDLAKFKASLADPKLKSRIEADQALAARLGATGTPTFIVGGEKVVGAQPFEAFKAAIDRQLAATAKR